MQFNLESILLYQIHILSPSFIHPSSPTHSQKPPNLPPPIIHSNNQNQHHRKEIEINPIPPYIWPFTSNS